MNLKLMLIKKNDNFVINFTTITNFPQKVLLLSANIMRPPWNKYKCEALYKHLNNEYLTLCGS